MAGKRDRTFEMMRKYPFMGPCLRSGYRRVWVADRSKETSPCPYDDVGAFLTKGWDFVLEGTERVVYGLESRTPMYLMEIPEEIMQQRDFEELQQMRKNLDTKKNAELRELEKDMRRHGGTYVNADEVTPVEIA